MIQKKKIIQIEPNADYVLFAVNSNLDEFRFCNVLNEELGINLQMQSPIEYELVNGKIIMHSYYSFHDSSRNLQYDLITNKTEAGVLIDFLNSIQYFIRFSSSLSETDSELIQKQISSIDSVIFIQNLQLSNFSTRQQKQLQHLFI